MNPHYEDVAQRAGHRCEYCRAPEALFNFPFEVEHIVPVSSGGDNDLDNLALACRACNVRKGPHLEALDPLTGAATRLFHPRLDLWGDHFRHSPNNNTVEGLTDIGRATVVRLEMNHTVHRTARKLWARIGLYP